MARNYLQPFRSYRVVSCVLAALLLLAGGLKIQDYWLRVGQEPGAWNANLGLGMGALLELLFAGWVFAGFLPRLTRCALLGVFITFLNFHLSGLLAGSSSCGCLGRVSLAPIYPIALDAAAVALLLICHRPESNPRDVRTNSWSLVGLVSFAIVAVLVFVGGTTWFRSGPGGGHGAVALSPQERQLIETVREGIERNYSLYPKTISMEMDRIDTNHAVQKEQTITKRHNDGTVTTHHVAPEFRHRYRYTIRGDSVRREIIRGDPVGRVETISQRNYLRISPQSKQAVYLSAEDTSGQEDTVDPRTLGFYGPLLRLSEWFDRSDITQVTQSQDREEQVVRVEARVVSNYTLQVAFQASRSWLPVSIVERHKDGSLFKVSTLTYRTLPQGNAWVLHTLEDRRWDSGRARGVDDRIAPGGSLKWTVLDPIRLDVEAPDELFDPPIPAGYLVHNRVGHGGAVRLIEPATSPAKLPTYGRRSTDASSYWPYFAALNGLLFLSCVVFRNQVRL